MVLVGVVGLLTFILGVVTGMLVMVQRYRKQLLAMKARIDALEASNRRTASPSRNGRHP